MPAKKKQPPKRPPINLGIMGEAGSGKSTAADTLPGPKIVLAFDSRTKMMPYLRGYDVEESEQDGVTVLTASHNGEIVNIVELYHNTDADTPDGWNKFRRRLRSLVQDIKDWGIQSVVFDSATFAALSARKYSEHMLNKAGAAKDHWMYVTDQLEDVIFNRLANLPSIGVNFVCTFHVDDDKDEAQGLIVRNAMMPGRLRKQTPALFGEFYRAFCYREGNSAKERAQAEPVYLFQTRPNESYNATTQLQPPDPCPANYEALWVNYDRGGE